MKAFQKNSFLFLLGLILIVAGSLAYLFLTGSTSPQPKAVERSTPTTAMPVTLTPALSPTPEQPCSSKQRDFQMGVAFPDWGTSAYGESDTKWQTELPGMRTSTAACWVEMPVLLHQSSLHSTTVVQGDATTSISALNYGVQWAHIHGLHVFVTLQLQVSGSQPWSGAINFSTYGQEQQWFASYWQTAGPYAVAAAQDGVEQFSIGTEYEWIEQNAPASLWNGLISEFSRVFPGTLTYNMNWGSLQKRSQPSQVPSWMRNGHLKMIGVSVYSPLVSAPVRVEPSQIFNLWKQTVKRDLDNFSIALGEPIFLSEIGYPNSNISLYHPWDGSSPEPPDPVEQAAAYDAALANIIPDPRILGTFFWGWDNTGNFNLLHVQAASVIHSHYQSLQG